MRSSLHLSDLSTNSFSYSTPKDSTRRSFGNNQSSIYQIHSKNNKIQQFSANIRSFENRLYEDKKQSYLSNSLETDNIYQEINQLDTTYIALQQKGNTVQISKHAIEQDLAEQKFNVSRLEDELRQLKKSSDWTDTTFSIEGDKQSSQSLSSEILKVQSDIGKVDTMIRNTKKEIFHFQKEAIRIADAKTPYKLQQQRLMIKIDDAKSDDSSSHSSLLETEFSRSFSDTFEKNKLLYNQSKLEKNIIAIQGQIDKVKSKKNSIQEKIYKLESTNNESLFHSIKEQTSQYKEATKRKSQLYSEKVQVAQFSISKEIDIGVQRDLVHESLKEVNQQIKEVREIIDHRNEVIANLEKTISIEDSFLNVPESDVVYKTLIEDIFKARAINYDLNQQLQLMDQSSSTYLQNISSDSSSDDSQSLTFDNDISEMKSNQDEIINNLDLELKIIKDSITQLTTLINDTDRSLNEQIQNAIRRRKEKTDDELTLDDMGSAKMRFTFEKIKDTQNEIKKLQKSNFAKKKHNQNKKGDLKNLLIQLNLPSNLPLLLSDAYEKFERSMNWLSKEARKSITNQISYQINASQAINNWDTNVVSASTNEIRDILTRLKALKSF